MQKVAIANWTLSQQDAKAVTIWTSYKWTDSWDIGYSKQLVSVHFYPIPQSNREDYTMHDNIQQDSNLNKVALCFLWSSINYLKFSQRRVVYTGKCKNPCSCLNCSKAEVVNSPSPKGHNGSIVPSHPCHQTLTMRWSWEDHINKGINSKASMLAQNQIVEWMTCQSMPNSKRNSRWLVTIQ